MMNNMNKLSLSIIATISLVGCDSSDSGDGKPSDTVAPHNVLVTVDAPESEFLAPSESESHPIEQLGGKVAKVYAKNGYPHFLRTDSYTLFVRDNVDGYGDNYEIENIDITNPELIDLTIYGEAELELVAPDDFYQGEIRYAYTATGTALIKRDDVSVSIKAKNDSRYSYVTVEANQNVDRMNTFVNDENLGIAVNEDQTEAYHVAYYTEDSNILITSLVGTDLYESLPYDESVATHYHFKVRKNEQDGEIIITPPDFGNPIEIEPKDPIVDDSQVTNGEVKPEFR